MLNSLQSIQCITMYWIYWLLTECKCTPAGTWHALNIDLVEIPVETSFQLIDFYWSTVMQWICGAIYINNKLKFSFDFHWFQFSFHMDNHIHIYFIFKWIGYYLKKYLIMLNLHGHVPIREAFIGSIFSINLVVQECDCWSFLDSLNNIVIQLI